MKTMKTACVFALIALLAGCVTTSRSSYERMPVTELEARYHKDPNNKDVAIALGEKLREAGRNDQAIAVLEKLAIKHPKDRTVLTAYGKGLVNVGRFDAARPILMRAFVPDHPDWTILSAMGSIEDQQGNSQRAREFYFEALKIRPNEPSVLSNLGLSFALDKKLFEAEQVLRKAAASPRASPKVRENHAMVVELIKRLPPSEQAEGRNVNVFASLPQATGSLGKNRRTQTVARNSRPRLAERDAYDYDDRAPVQAAKPRTKRLTELDYYSPAEPAEPAPRSSKRTADYDDYSEPAEPNP
ncbi:MAG: tetratricopeptide repeat protein, partial [Methylobacteriaceae bacterium]|nr:tetratricopeptide repeat protein [Methylobacteriaceae bacterium]